MKKISPYIALAVLVIAGAALVWVIRSPQATPTPVPAASSTPQVQTASSTSSTQATSSPESSLPAIEIDGITLHVLIANTPALQEKGLGDRSGLPPGEGMLFIFQQDAEYAFWMKDMEFSLDMLWIADDGAIVYIAQDVAPSTYPENFVPTSPARYVLEVPAGFVKEYNVHLGDIVRLD